MSITWGYVRISGNKLEFAKKKKAGQPAAEKLNVAEKHLAA